MQRRHDILWVVVVLWFVLIFWLASQRVFVSRSNQPPIAIAVAFAAPILFFLAGIKLSPTLRQNVISVAPILLIAMNGWRFVGMGFLMGHAEGLLPGGFAWPAGMGDIVMAATAPWIAARVTADDRFRFGSIFLIWNLLGISDFLVAVFLGTLYMWPGHSGPMSTALMQRLPLALIPGFFVPLVAMGHITLLVQRGAAIAATQ